MLRYLGSGLRQFGRFPLKPRVRMNWEFFAVIRGRCALCARPGDRPKLLRQTLWVSPPGSAHTWAPDGANPVEIAVFHFGSVPAPLAGTVREKGPLALALTPAECRRVVALARQLKPDFEHPTQLSHLVFQGALIELTLLALRKLPQLNLTVPKAHGERIVAAATEWYAGRVEANPSINEAAGAVHVSPSTLRRLFQRTLREQPTRVFRRIQIEKGMRLMTETKLKLEGIAKECGFTNTSDFCRAFRAVAKVSPNVWRRTILAAPRAATGGSGSG